MHGTAYRSITNCHVDKPHKTSINERRAAEVVKTGPEAVVTACPICLQMFVEDMGRKKVGTSTGTIDLAEVIEGSFVQG
jgi:Fe-S oxidoreductase